MQQIFSRHHQEFCQDGFSDVPLTSVFGGYILSGSPFVETPGAGVLTFLQDAVAKFGIKAANLSLLCILIPIFSFWEMSDLCWTRWQSQVNVGCFR